MRTLLVMAMALTLAASALAAQDPLGSRYEPGPKGQGDGATNPRTGGDTIENATVIPSLPYTDTGATCGFAQDYSDCVYNAGAPDVVYGYTPASDGSINVSLCGSGYDTGLWVYAGRVGNTVGCNDDFCGLQSEINGIAVTAAVTYYIVVSGFSTACGSYQLSVTGDVPCDVICPPGSIPEGEDPCPIPPDWPSPDPCDWVTVISGDENGNRDICGASGTYIYNGDSYRDTDWYEATGDGGVMTFSCTAEFPLQIIFMYGSCENPLYDITTAGPCIEATLSRTVVDGTQVWLWVAPSVFSGVPCTGLGSEYWMHVTGLYPGPANGACCLVDGSCDLSYPSECTGLYQGDGTVCDPNPCGTPVEATSWGGIKDRFERH